MTPDGFLPLIGTDLTDKAATGGIRFDVGGFRADFSVGYGQNKFDYIVDDTVNASFATPPRRYDAGGLKYSQTLVNLDLSREFEVGFAKPLTFSFGGEYRRETYAIRPGEFESYALGPFFRAQINGSNAVACAAQQGVFNVTTNACTFPDARAEPARRALQGYPLRLRPTLHEATWRVMSNSTPISSTASRLRRLDATNIIPILATPFPASSPRGSSLPMATRYAARFSNGFRAPSLHQQVFTTTSTNFIAGVPVEILTAPVSTPLAQALGAKPLKAEKSVNFSAGITANPMSGLTLTVDYYNIKINDRIVLTENLGSTTSAADAADP